MAFTEITNEEIDLAFPTSNYKTAADRPKRVLANNILKKLRDNYNDSVDFRIDVWEWHPTIFHSINFNVEGNEVTLTWTTDFEGTLNVYRDTSPFDVDNLPAVYDTVSADAGTWTDVNADYDTTYYYALGVTL